MGQTGLRGRAARQFERRLREIRQEIEANRMRVANLAAAGRVPEEDLVPASHEEFVSLELNDLDYQKLRLIDEALDRIAAGDYGVCLGCDRPIPDKRLRAVPWARYCVDCQERLAEQQEPPGG